MPINKTKRLQRRVMSQKENQPPVKRLKRREKAFDAGKINWWRPKSRAC